MAKIDAHQKNDKKRNGGNFKPQGKKGAKKNKVTTGGHVNKYSQFSQAAGAMAALEMRKEAERKQAARETYEQRMGSERRW